MEGPARALSGWLVGVVLCGLARGRRWVPVMERGAEALLSRWKGVVRRRLPKGRRDEGAHSPVVLVLGTDVMSCRLLGVRLVRRWVRLGGTAC
jgi:hypothetical protein